MSNISPQGAVYQAGTLSGNPLAMTAGVETLRRLTPDVYDQLESTSEALANGIRNVVKSLQTTAVVQRVGSMLTLFFHDRPVRNFADARQADHERFGSFFQNMLSRGVHLPPSGYEAWFVSTAHDSAAIQMTIEAVQKSL